MFDPHAKDNADVAKVLDRLGVGPLTVRRLTEYAKEDRCSLREFVLYVLTDYAPPEERSDD